ncbi:Uncharacterized protein DAT39_014421 [Clarias magur]|uniref:Uncharacterized protein n=1 Tax=Clarias magur TaxID=1594786 RepID=A0A8J4TIE2_CLAMG|nr:Uncharacterized protein DAT39_014421 [Clarias magur]
MAWSSLHSAEDFKKYDMIGYNDSLFLVEWGTPIHPREGGPMHHAERHAAKCKSRSFDSAERKDGPASVNKAMPPSLHIARMKFGKHSIPFPFLGPFRPDSHACPPHCPSAIPCSMERGCRRARECDVLGCRMGEGVLLYNVFGYTHQRSSVFGIRSRRRGCLIRRLLQRLGVTIFLDC